MPTSQETNPRPRPTIRLCRTISNCNARKASKREREKKQNQAPIYSIELRLFYFLGLSFRDYPLSNSLKALAAKSELGSHPSSSPLYAKKLKPSHDSTRNRRLVEWRSLEWESMFLGSGFLATYFKDEILPEWPSTCKCHLNKSRMCSALKQLNYGGTVSSFFPPCLCSIDGP